MIFYTYYCQSNLFMFPGPLVGKYLSILGVKIIYPAGFILDGLTFILFGLLHWVDNIPTFLILSYTIRFLEGVGAAATWNSNLSILMAKFPDRKATVKAWCDASFNTGLTLGPVIGAFLYEAGGFSVPFFLGGSMIIVSGALVYLVTDMPTIEKTESTYSVMKFVTKPAILAALFSATVSAYTIGTLEATLSTFLGKIPSMTVKMIAMTFLTMSLSSVLATPVSGWVCDNKLSPWIVSALGCVTMSACFMFLGPAPYLATIISPTMMSVCLSLVLQGVGSAMVLVASFSCAQISAVTAGLPDASDTQAVVAGLFTSAFAAGNFFGPSISGVLFDAVGFSYNCLIIQLLLILTTLFNFLFYSVTRKISFLPDIIVTE